MPTREQILEALRDVQDPEIHKSIVDLNMVRDIRIDGSRVHVTVALTIRGCPLRDEFQRMIKARLLEMPGVTDVDVTLTEMTPEERQALFGGDKLQKVPLLSPESPTQIIGVASGKGGVGKSTVTVNLAAALRRLGYSVGVLDADIYGFSVPRMLGLEGKPTAIEGKIMPMPAYGLKVISMGNFVDNNQPIIWRGPMLGKVLQQFLTDVLWGDLDYMLLDLPPGTGDMALDVARMIPRSNMLIVTTPQTVASGVASRAAHMAAKANQRVIGVVENMSHFVCPDCGKATALFGEGGGAALARELGVELLGQIPLTLPLREGSDRGVPIVFQEGTEKDPARQAIEALAQRIVALCPVAVRS
ncbi:MAG TPA: Mrp/NBP35 family ATP-binding protein [Limnochordales bacterium]